MTHTPTRAAGLDRLSDFLPRAGRAYAAKRNFDLGPGKHNGVSVLSPYTRMRMVTEREIVEKTLAQHSLQESEKFVQEVFWRTYFKGRLENDPQVWSRYNRQVDALISQMQTDERLAGRYNQAITGQTGIEGFDDWARELTDHNYLHNHARMWFASIWIFTLELPWELGADFFMQHLLDGDPASNTLSWRWVGGLHTKGKTYLARQSNIEQFTAGRFSPDNLSPAADALYEEDYPALPAALPADAALPGAPWLWLLHEDDVAEIGEGYAAKAGLMPKADLRRAEAVSKFRNAAIQNALGGDGQTVAGAQELVDLCAAKNIKDIVTPYAPTGPGQDALKSIGQELKSAGINLHVHLRDWDRLTWPYATAGFFKVKKKIPNILDGLNQGRLL